MTDVPFTVAKYAHTEPLAETACGGCGQPMLYNLAVGYVGHTDTAVDPCDEPWPDEPRPQWVKDAFARAEELRRGVERLDQIMFGGNPAPAWAVRPQ